MNRRDAKTVFFDLIELPESERAAHMREACAHDPELHTRVMALLRAHTNAGGFLGEAGTEGLTSITSVVSESDEPLPPESIGPYKVLRTLGHGGFGTVYLCQQSEPIQRQIAIKVIREGMDTRNILRRFEEERILLSKMDHPGIARVLDAGRSDQGLPFIAMEYIAGERITDYCDQKLLDLRTRLELFAQACIAVQHAHQKGVIHRDLKPSNVLVTEIDGKPIVKVIDFGVSKVVDDRAGEDAITRTMQLVGTPQYMSPEQASTVDADIDTRTDVYSLGVMLYELSTGFPPFDPEKLRSASVGQLERMIREIDPVRPSARVERLEGKDAAEIALQRSTAKSAIVRQLKGELDWIIARAMDKSRDRRYPSAFAIAEDVHRVLSGKMVHARPPSRVYALRKLIARNKTIAISAMLVAGAFVGVSVLSVVSASRIQNANKEIQSTLRTQEQVMGFTEEMLRGIDPAVAQGKDTELFRLLLDRAADRVENDLGSSAEVEIRIRLLMGELYSAIGEFDEAMAQIESAVRIGEATFGKQHKQTLAARSALGAAYVELSRYEDARSILESGYRDARLALGEQHPDTLVVLGNLAAAYNYLGDHDAAVQAGEMLLQMRISTLGDQHEDTMSARNALALAYRGRQELERARTLLERVLAFQMEHLGDGHPKTLKTRTNLAQSYQELGMLSESIAMNEKILEQKIEVLGETHPSVLVSMVNLATVLQSADNQQRSIDLLTRAHEISLETLGETHQYTLIIRNNLGNYFAKNKNFEQALPWIRLACDGLVKQFGDHHPMVIKGQGNLIDVLIDLDRFAEALEIAIGNRLIALEVHGPSDTSIGIAHKRVAICLLNLDQEEDAQPYLRSAAESYLKHKGRESDEYNEVLSLLNETLED